MHPVDIPAMTSTGTTVSRPPRLSWVVAACLAFATFLAYANSFRGVFVLDDIPDILQNPAMRSLQTPVATMRTITSPGWGPWRSISSIARG